MGLKGIKDHVEGEYYGDIVRERNRPYCVQETIMMLMKKGLTYKEALSEIPVYCQEAVKEIFQRG